MELALATERPLGNNKKRVVYLSRPDITIKVFGRAINPNSMKKSVQLSPRFLLPVISIQDRIYPVYSQNLLNLVFSEDVVL